MLLLVLTLFGCSAEPPADAPAPEPVVVAAAPAPAPAADEPAADEPAAAKPKGSIGGEPILPDPVVVGAISTEDVRTGMAPQMDAINGCWSARAKERPGLAGKVLVKVIIAKDGSVTTASTKSSSLRDPATETCVNSAIAKASFAPLSDGRLAVVSYPFVFPPG